MHYFNVTIAGLVIAWIARAVQPERDDRGLIMTAILGIGGLFAGTFIGQSPGFYKRAKTLCLSCRCSAPSCCWWSTA
jgi:uncharacterized membrane protein YeaQ/YmgE (transglycosylase-associated protein family)